MEDINKKEKLDFERFLMFWGFVMFIFGLLGIIQIGILDGISVFILYGSLIMIIGLIILCFLIFSDRMKR